MSAQTDGGPAFPRPTEITQDPHLDYSQTEHWIKSEPGMTLRDYFAIRAPLESIEVEAENGENWYEAMARVSYEYADAMLKVRSKTNWKGAEV